MMKFFLVCFLNFKRLSIVLLLVLSLFFLDIKAAFAHRPHDVVTQVIVSPSYQQDKTLFIIVRGNLFQSTDEGDSWKRVGKGLNNRYNLASLSISSLPNQTFYLSSEGNEIYKSQDKGNSWTKINQDLEIGLLSISPDSPDVVLAAGIEKGLYKTTNGGENWQKVIDNNHKITAIAFLSDKKDQIVLGDNQGVLYISNDGGDNWQPSNTLQKSGAITAIAASPKFSSDGMFFVGTEKEGIFKTLDKGVSFSEQNQGLSDTSVRDIIVSQNYAKDSTLFVSTGNEGFFYSNNGGKTWNKSVKGLTKDHQADSMKSPHFTDLTLSDKTLFLGGFNGLFKSTDAGLSWSEIVSLSPETLIALAVSPNYENDSTVVTAPYVGNPYISHDKGQTWEPMKSGIEVPRLTGSFEEPDQDPRRFFDIAFSPSYDSDKTIFATLLWDSFLKSTDGGKHWDIIPLEKESGYATRGIAIAPSPAFASDKTIYLLTQQGAIYKSTNGGEKFSVIGKIGKNFTNEPSSIAISPDFLSDKTLYGSSSEPGVYKSVDGGDTWQAVTNGTPLMETQSIRLAISPNYKADQTVLAGTDRGIFQTTDAGQSWVRLADSTDIEEEYIEGVAISPNYQSDRTFMVSVKGKGLWKTTDGAQTFTPVGDSSLTLARMNNVPSAGKPIVFSPAYASDRTLYGFGSATADVFTSTDGGNIWDIIALPAQESNKVGLLTSINLGFYVYRSRILRVVLATIAALFTYFILGYLSLEKKLPFRKLQIKAVGSFLVFVVTLVLSFS